MYNDVNDGNLAGNLMQFTYKEEIRRNLKQNSFALTVSVWFIVFWGDCFLFYTSKAILSLIDSLPMNHWSFYEQNGASLQKK